MSIDLIIKALESALNHTNFLGTELQGISCSEKNTHNEFARYLLKHSERIAGDILQALAEARKMQGPCKWTYDKLNTPISGCGVSGCEEMRLCPYCGRHIDLGEI